MGEQVLPIASTPDGGPTPVVLLLTESANELGDGGASTLRAEARATSARLDRRFASRSYAGRFAVVAGCDSPVGVDIEEVGHFDDAEAASILTPAELDLGLELDDELCTVIWSSKEALAKALGDARCYDPRRLDSPLTWGAPATGRWRAARLAGLPLGYVGWVCWQAPQAEPPPGYHR